MEVRYSLQIYDKTEDMQNFVSTNDAVAVKYALAIRNNSE